MAANAARIPLAKMAVEETRMGVVEDKVIKNHFASEYIYNRYKDEKTCGIVHYDEAGGMTKIAEPVGVVAGIVPTTNPTSTTIFKALLCLKTRNSLVLCPHPRARKATIAAAKIVADAAEAAGAPPGVVQWVENPSMVMSQALMKAPEVSLILATGGPAMVRSAYSSGHPSVGVGAGNTPAVIDETANVNLAVSSILLSKTFDNGVICSTEQSVVVVDAMYDAIKAEFIRRGAYFLNEEEKNKVRSKMFVDGRLNADMVGQSAYGLGKLFGVNVPKKYKVLIGEIEKIGDDEPLSHEKLSPLLAMYRAPNFEAAVDMADKLVMFAGAGHTSVLYTNQLNRKNMEIYGNRMKTVRILVNTPASLGAIGDVYNFHLDPSLTLGCGSWGSTSVSTNVGPAQMLNYKSLTERRENMLWIQLPPKVYFKPGCLEVALRDLKGKQRAFIVTDKYLYDTGLSEKVTKIMDEIHIQHRTFSRVPPDPTLAAIRDGLAEVNDFKPDVIIALGGGSPMDAAKIMWLLYEQPDTKFDGVAMRFMDIRKRVYDLPKLGAKAEMVCIPTTSGTGSEVTPFSVVTDEATGEKYPLADYALTPHMAIVDPHLVMGMPKKLTAYGGIDALTHALESYVSIYATDYTRGLAKEAVRILFKYLPAAYADGQHDLKAREKVHYAATIAGMSFANAFLGICHSMAHKLGARFHVAHGPRQRGSLVEYADLADLLCLGGTTQEDKVVRLIAAVEELKAKVDIPPTIREIVGAEREGEYMATLEALSEQAFDDQCTGANPRYPLIKDLRKIYQDAWSTPITDVIAAAKKGGCEHMGLGFESLHD
ncbi:MAG: acetaldehyde dehydrogenase [Monoraphidium minutum]|nr:MAG: acetaldehyde dehydrogenase [Monoraphidium minutum]